MKKLAIIIPTLNEALSLSITINEIINLYSKKVDLRFYIIESGDIEITKKSLNKIKFKNIFLIFLKKEKRPNNCKAIRIGSEIAYSDKNNQYFLEFDADGAYDPLGIKDALTKIEKHNFVIASKYNKKSKINRKFVRRLYSYMYTFICRVIFNNNVTDYSTSFKMYDRFTMKLYLNNQMKYKGAPQHLDNILNLIVNNNIIPYEIPMVYRDRIHGKSGINFRELLYCMFEFIKCINFYLGKSK